MNSERGKAICILGMHRSGTSAITRAINLLGAYIGDAERLMPSAPDNPEGFWEHCFIYDFHERLLKFFSSSWHNNLPLPEDWWKQPEIEPYREELIDFIKGEFGNQPLWVWKDPRTSLLIPLWKDVLNELGIDVSYIICLRNPLDVAISLGRRNGFPKGKSLTLWVYYNLSSLYWTIGSKRLVLNYDEFLINWEWYLKRVAEVCDIPWPQDANELNQAMSTFLKPTLRHSYTETESLMRDADVPKIVVSLYHMLLELAKNQGLLDSKGFSEEVSKLYIDYVTFGRMGFLKQWENNLSVRDIEHRLQQQEALILQKNIEIARLRAIEESLAWKTTRRFIDLIEKWFPWNTKRGRLYLRIIERIQQKLLPKLESTPINEGIDTKKMKFRLDYIVIMRL
jgi:hypothetical protein